LWLHITASLGLICRSHGRQRTNCIQRSTWIARSFARLLRPIP
jgi:hypothetical protein